MVIKEDKLHNTLIKMLLKPNIGNKSYHIHVFVIYYNISQLSEKITLAAEKRSVKTLVNM
jgi:hypothetical protein